MTTELSWARHIEAPSDTVRLAVVGELDLATAPLLGLRMLTIIDAHHPAAVYVDLSEVTFLDCSAISVFVTVRNATERAGCQIRICHPQPTIAHILDLFGLLGPFTAPIDPTPPRPSSTALPGHRSRCAGVHTT